MSFHSLMCRDPLTPMLNSSEVVRRTAVKTIPFELHVIKDHSNMSQAGNEQYRVEISSKNSLLKLSMAQIAVIKTETCGYGELTFTRTAFYKEEPASRLCPLMLITKSPEEMHKSPPLLWKPPTCGCVQFRVLVFEDETGYYRDEKDVNNGLLTNTVCVRKREDHQQYSKALCRVHGRYSAAEIVNRDSFKIRHGLRDAAVDKRLLVAVYEGRLERIAGCCSEQTDILRERCLDRARFHRVDRLCEDGIPDLSFTALRRAHTRTRERKCCFIMGSHRYTCFNHRSDFPSNSSEAGILDYSLDETDPLNDLSDIATHQDGDILSMLSRLDFGAKFESDAYESVSMIDIGSKQVSSEEKSTEVSQEVVSSRKVSEVKDDLRPFGVPEVAEGRGIVTAAENIQAAQPRQLPVETPSSAPTGGSSRRRGRKRGRNSGRKRNSGQRRRSGRASRESRRRNKERRRLSSKERRQRANSRARQSRMVESTRQFQFGVNRDPDNRMLSAEKTRLSKRMERQRLTKTCCAQGEEYGSRLIVNSGENFRQLCSDEAETRESIILDFESKQMANICWFSFSDCCENAYLISFDMEASDMLLRKRFSQDIEKIQRDEPEVKSDERGEDLDLGSEYAEDEKESEKRYQNMREPQIVEGDDDEEKDGPARHDEMDQRQENGRSVAADTVSYVEDTRGASGQSVEERSTASEEIQDFDDRAFGDSLEDDEDDDDAEDEGDEDDQREIQGGTMFEASGVLNRQRTSRIKVGRSQEARNSVRRRNSIPWSSRARNRSNTSRGRRRTSRGGRNSRARSSRLRLNHRNSHNLPGRYRSLPESPSRSSRVVEYSDSRRTSRKRSYRNSKNNGGYSRRQTDRRFTDDQRGTEWTGRHHKRRKIPLDSKEMAQQYQQPETGMDLLRTYYEKK